MYRLIKILSLLVFIPLFSCGQNEISKIKTESTYANQGDYNELNNHILFVAIGDSLTAGSSQKASIKIRNLNNKKEKTIVPNIYLDSPAFGWLDSSHVFYEKTVVIGAERAFGPWQGYLIRHNIYTNQEDTIPSDWYSSDNYVKDFHSSHGKLFYTISYNGNKGGEWVEYSIKNKKNKIIKKYSDVHNFKVLTYQYLSESNEIIYIKGFDSKREFIKISISKGTEEVIKTIKTDNPIESSALIAGKFYYLERESIKNNDGGLDFKSYYFVIKSLDINSGKIELIYSFEKGVEVSHISRFKEGELLVSVQGSLDIPLIGKKADLPSGGDIIIGLNPTSYLYIITL